MARRRRQQEGYVLAPIDKFEGLNLRDQPHGAGSLDLLNTTFTDLGAVRSRDGMQEWSAAAHDAVALIPHISGAGVRELLVLRRTNSTDLELKALDNTGAVIAGAGWTNALAALTMASPLCFAKLSAPTIAPTTYITGPGWARKYGSVAGYATPTCTTINALTGATTAGQAYPRGALACAWGNEERLLFGGFDTSLGPGSLTTDPDTIWATEPGQPEQFKDSANFKVGAGDGEKLMGIVAWRDLIFIFKETRFWVLSAIQPQSDSSVRFIRRVVATGVGAAGRFAIAVARDGVYFMGRRGLYKTTGGDPQLVSGIVEPLWGASPLPIFYSGGAIGDLTTPVLQTFGEQLLLSFRSTLNLAGGLDRTLVYDLRYGWYSLWDCSHQAMCSFRASDGVEYLIGEPSNLVAGTGQKLRRLVMSSVGDAGNPFKSFYFGGFRTYGQERTVRARQIAVWGLGSIDVGLAVDYERNAYTDRLELGANADLWGDGAGPDTWQDGSSSVDFWGLGLSLDGTTARSGWRGSRFALSVAHNPATLADQKAWLVARAVVHVAGVRQSSAIRGA